MNEERVVVRRTDADPLAGPYASETVQSESVRRTPSGAEVARRVVVFVFGIIQLLIVLRLGLLVLDADRGNDLVDAIYRVSGVFVAPFEGILRTGTVGSDGSVLDIAALVALIGWTILELVVIAGIGILRREP